MTNPAPSTFDRDTFQYITERASDIAPLLSSSDLAFRRLGAELHNMLLGFITQEMPQITDGMAAEALNVYHAIWRQMHTRSRKWRGGDDSAFLESIAKALPRDCACGSNFARFRKSNPPDFTSAETYFAWTVHCHNEVNKLLGKRQYTVEEALALYPVPVTPPAGGT